MADIVGRKMSQSELHNYTLLELVYSFVIQHLQALQANRALNNASTLFIAMTLSLCGDVVYLNLLRNQDPDEFDRTCRMCFYTSLNNAVHNLCVRFSVVQQNRTSRARRRHRRQAMYKALKKLCNSLINYQHS
jgi:hypothetical protein